MLLNLIQHGCTVPMESHLARLFGSCFFLYLCLDFSSLAREILFWLSDFNIHGAEAQQVGSIDEEGRVQ